MQLLLSTPGSSLSQENQCFLLQNHEKKLRLSPERIDRIVIAHHTQISSAAILLAMEHHIDLVLLDSFGDPAGRFWQGRVGRVARIRRHQVLLSSSTDGFRQIALPWLSQKLRHQLLFLKTLAKARPAERSSFASSLASIQDSLDRFQSLPSDLPLDDLRALVMGLEGSAAKSFFASISSVLPPSFRFSQRSRRPPLDPFNAALNYAYGILYSLVERAVLLAGLDPYVGFLHADHPYRPSLVCDLIEPFRLWADQTVTYLFTRRTLQAHHFEISPSSVFLSPQGKPILVDALFAFLHQSIRHSRRHVQRASLIQLEAHRTANFLLLLAPLPPTWEVKTLEF